MKKAILPLLIITLFSCSEKNEINFKVSHLVNDSIPSIRIKMVFKPNKEGETILTIADDAWGQKDLFETISKLKSNQVTEIIKQKDSGWILLKHKKNTPEITLEYVLKQDFEGPMDYTKFYRPVVQETYFHLLSHSMFMLPETYVSDSNKRFDVDIDWEDFDVNYNIINSFGSNTKRQSIINTNAEEFRKAIFTGGDYNIFNLDINGNKVVFNTRGKWKSISETEIAEHLRTTIQVQRDFWQDHTQDYFTVIMTPTYLKEGSALQGTRLTNSFATAISNNEFLKTKELIKLFNHELMHNWIGGVINYESEELYWFSEGFTEYIALKNIAHNKIGSSSEGYFIKELNGYIKSLFASSAREVPNNKIMDRYWDDIEYNRLPYRRGVLFAFYLDNKIKQDSKGGKNLQDLMLEFKKQAIENNKEVNHEYFLETANIFLSNELNPFFIKHIEKGKFFDLQAIFEEFDYDIDFTGEVFDLGFSFTDENEKYIGNIDIGSNAYKAGLRKGDRVVSQSYTPGNPEYKASFKIIKGNEKESFSFFPSKKVSIPSLLDNPKNRNKISLLN